MLSLSLCFSFSCSTRSWTYWLFNIWYHFLSPISINFCFVILFLLSSNIFHSVSETRSPVHSPNYSICSSMVSSLFSQIFRATRILGIWNYHDSKSFVAAYCLYFLRIEIEYMNRYSSLNSSMSFWKGQLKSPCDFVIVKHFGKNCSMELFVQRTRFFREEQRPTFDVRRLLLLKWFTIWKSWSPPPIPS